MLPTPPIITTTSAFMVNSTPIAGLKVRKVLTSVPATATSAPPRREGDRRHRGGVDADQAGAGRLDRERTHRGAEPRALQEQPDREPERAGDAEGEHPVGGEGEADDLHRRVEIVVEAVVAA